MKSTYTQTPKEEVSRKYPYLGKYESISARQIVLFTSKNTGTLIEQDRGDLGHHSDDWEESHFNPLPKGERVTLEND